MVNQEDSRMTMQRQHSRHGKTGFVGETEGKVIVVDRPSPGSGGTIPAPPTLDEAIKNLSDDELEALGIQRVQEDEVEEETPSAEESETTTTDDDGEEKKEAKRATPTKRRKAPAKTKAQE